MARSPRASCRPALTIIAASSSTAWPACWRNFGSPPMGWLARPLGSEWDIFLSSDVLPEIREYERPSSTVITAYLKPVVRPYLKGVRDDPAPAGVQAPLLIMQPNGGIMPVPAAQERP